MCNGIAIGWLYCYCLCSTKTSREFNSSGSATTDMRHILSIVYQLLSTSLTLLIARNAIKAIGDLEVGFELTVLEWMGFKFQLKS